MSTRAFVLVVAVSLAGCMGPTVLVVMPDGTTVAPPPGPVVSPPVEASRPELTAYGAEVLDDDPVAYWRFEEESGDIAFDSSGRQRHGVYLNGPAMGQSLGNGRTGRAVSLQNDTDGVFVEFASWTNLRELTVEAWVRPSVQRRPEGMIVADKGSTWNLFIDPSGRPAFQLPGDSPPETMARSPIVVGETYHLVGTFQRGVMRLYVNGVGVSEGTAMVREIPNRDTPIHVGRGLGARRWEFQGVIDDVALYDRALSAEAIRRHYGAGR